MPTNKTSSELVIDLLNDANSTDLTLNQIQFDEPDVLENDISERNTGLLINAIPLHGYTGNVSVKYNRIDISELSNLADPIIEIPDEGDINDILSELSALYSIILQADIDIDSDVDLSGVTTTPSNITLYTLETCYAFYGSIEITVSRIAPQGR